MKRDFTLLAVLWTVLAILTAWGVSTFGWYLYPTHGAEEATVVDEAFTILSYMAVPVVALVLAIEIVAILRFRSKGEPTEDGARLTGEGNLPKFWLIITSALAVVMIIWPGLTGIIELSHHKEPGLHIKITGQMWAWSVEYPDQGVKIPAAQEFVLPVGTTVQIDVESKDVLHSFWVPAFRQKIDAVPGKTTTVYITPDQTGNKDSDIAYRLQCAELCGVGHSLMANPVKVVEQRDFDSWLAGQKQRAEAR
ncbi:MAG: cytochrome c oxidase subunit II [Dehalococcoidia bacterium]